MYSNITICVYDAINKICWYIVLLTKKTKNSYYASYYKDLNMQLSLCFKVENVCLILRVENDEFSRRLKGGIETETECVSHLPSQQNEADIKCTFLVVFQ